MRIRFCDPQLRRLYETGDDDALPPETITAFFCVLGAVIAARDLDDLQALRSLDARVTGGAVSLLVDGPTRLSATMEEGDDGSFLRIDMLTHGAGITR
jgi:hypothetical protein